MWGIRKTNTITKQADGAQEMKITVYQGRILVHVGRKKVT